MSSRNNGEIVGVEYQRIAFDKPLTEKLNITYAKIEGDIELRGAIFIFEECIFNHYAIKLCNATAYFVRCVFGKRSREVGISVLDDSALDMCDCTTRDVWSFLRINTPQSRHSIRGLKAEGALPYLNTPMPVYGVNATYLPTVNGSSANTYPVETIPPLIQIIRAHSVVITNLNVIYKQPFVDNCPPAYSANRGLYNQYTGVYIGPTSIVDFNTQSLPPAPLLFSVIDMHSIGTLMISEAAVNTPLNTIAVFVNAPTDAHVYITRSSLIGIRLASIYATSMDFSGMAVATINGVPISPPIGQFPTNMPNSNIVTPTQQWPWPQRFYVTHSDISYKTMSNVTSSIVQGRGAVNIGLVMSTVVTNGLNTPISIRDASTTTVNVIGTNMRSDVDMMFIDPSRDTNPITPWIDLTNISGVARVEYSMATSYFGLDRLSATNVGVLKLNAAGAVA